MPQVELIMPKMGESIIEATILNWVKQVGDPVEVDETVLEIATDKVDSEVPSPVNGTLAKILYEADSIIKVGEAIALIESDEPGSAPVASERAAPPPAVAEQATDEANDTPLTQGSPSPPPPNRPQTRPQPAPQPATQSAAPSVDNRTAQVADADERYYSPLVRTMARAENIGAAELAQIPGTGAGGRVNKSDMEAYLKRRDNSFLNGTHAAPASAPPPSPPATAPTMQPQQSAAPLPRQVTRPAGGQEIIQMDRMRKLIAKHMVDSKRTAPHVTSFVECDVTPIVEWRNRIKKRFQEQHGQKITFTPIFMEAVAKAIKDFPLINVSVDGETIIKKHDINLGMAAALPSGNLIVPVIRNADRLNLLGLTQSVNDLAARARDGALQPEEIQGGTFTLTNVGTFGNVMGTPIINQPQVAILAVGTIQKKPAVVETEYGDLIAIRHKMFMSLSYDHRVVDGFLGGSFLRRVADYLEAFDDQRTDV